ncbi:MAG: 2-amino-4-ketopentanoate thiolase [Acholeplasmataceae bacterium]|nr:MAG: 2-amino-4-ketopentanoate thiolase [Acholeplasmataceae bacterium]
MIEKMTFVQIIKTILKPEERAPQVPQDTKRVPFEFRLKGKLLTPGNIGDEVDIVTETGRVETGRLLQVEPHFTHSFGHHVKAMRRVRDLIKSETEDLA